MIFGDLLNGNWIFDEVFQVVFVSVEHGLRVDGCQEIIFDVRPGPMTKMFGVTQAPMRKR